MENEELPQGTPPTEYKLDYNGQQLDLYWDGFCLTVGSEKFAFVASVNDPSVHGNGNVSIIFGTAEEIAQRIPM